MSRLPAIACIERGREGYPPSLVRFLGEGAPERIFLLGNAKLLDVDALGLFCSMKCPGNVILKALDLAKALREAGIPVLGAFHTSMERECLNILLRGTEPVIICPARGLEGMRLPSGVADGVKAERVLLVSPFGPTHRRANAELASQRNRFTAVLAGKAFVPHAAKAGKTEALCRDIVGMGKRLFTIDCPENANLLALGAKPLTCEEIAVLRGLA